MNYQGNNIPGWMTPADLTWLYERARKMASVVEIGSWQGRSTHALLSGCRGPVVAVDKWDVELMKPYGDALAARDAFFKNMKMFPNLTTMAMDSLKAATAFMDGSVEMVFIDGNHNYEPFRADLLAWLPKATKLICGHDYLCGWPGVDRAVKEVFGNKAKASGAIWYVELS